MRSTNREYSSSTNIISFSILMLKYMYNVNCVQYTTRYTHTHRPIFVIYLTFVAWIATLKLKLNLFTSKYCCHAMVATIGLRSNFQELSWGWQTHLWWQTITNHDLIMHIYWFFEEVFSFNFTVFSEIKSSITVYRINVLISFGEMREAMHSVFSLFSSLQNRIGFRKQDALPIYLDMNGILVPFVILSFSLSFLFSHFYLYYTLCAEYEWLSALFRLFIDFMNSDSLNAVLSIKI